MRRLAATAEDALIGIATDIQMGGQLGKHTTPAVDQGFTQGYARDIRLRDTSRIVIVALVAVVIVAVMIIII